MTDGSEEHTIDHGKVRVYSVAFGARGRKIVSGCSDGSVRVVNAATGEVVMRKMLGKKALVYGVTIDRVGHRIAVGCEDKVLRCSSPMVSSPISLRCEAMKSLNSVFPEHPFSMISL